MVATDVVELFQVPPANASVKVVVPPEAQTLNVPPIAAGKVLIVTGVVAGAQPVGRV